MGSECIGDVVDIVMGQSPPGESCNCDGLGVPLLNGPTEFGSHHPDPVQYTTDARKLAKVGDLLFCVRGSTTGRMNWADREYAIGRGIAAIRHKLGPDLQPFVRSVVENYLPQLLVQATGSTFPNVSYTQLASIPWPIISELEMRRVAHILGTLDDKIELNRQMNKTLEEMARALFKSWFVDFDPVRAKMSGRWTRTTPLPGLPTSLFDLFPDHLVHSSLGEIPAGWEVVRADSLFSVGIGKTPPRKEEQWFSTSPSDLRWMSIKDLGLSCVFIASVSEYLTRDAQQRFRVRVIPDDTVVLSFKLTVGRVAITDGEMLSNEAIAHFVPMAGKRIPSSYLYCYLRQYDYESLGSTSSIASAVNSESVRSIQILVPSREVLAAYEETVFHQFRRIKACQRENANIESMGHMLLAELIGNS